MNDVNIARDPAPASALTDDLPRLHDQPDVTDRDAADARLFAGMRVILAFAALSIIYIDPTEPSSREALTYGTLASYCGYAAAVLAVTSKPVRTPDQRLLCAIDVLFASVLVLWTQGTNSIFFYIFFFPILVVSFSHGYRDGLVFTIAGVAAFLLSGTLADPPILEFELNLALIRPLYLLALGYMIARWVAGRSSSNADCCCCAT